MDEFDEPTLLVGPRWEAICPGSERFDSLCKAISTATSRTGNLSRHESFLMLPPRDDFITGRQLAVAQEKITQAHRLLLGAQAILHTEHKRAKSR